MDINVKSKFNIAQEVFCISDYTKQPICEVCEGNEIITASNEKGTYNIKCPNCNGTGRIDNYSIVLWEMKDEELPWTINSLTLNMYKYENCKPNFSYGISGNNCSAYIEEEDCFNTLEEALFEIKKRNDNPEYTSDEE